MKGPYKENRAIPHAEHLTIMMLDLCSYTSLSTRLNRQTLHELHDLFDDIAIPLINQHHGIVIKKIGDAFLATFKSPTNALHCSRALQNKFFEYNKINQPRYPLRIKIALHTGEVILKGSDIYGDAVNITSRIESIARPGQVFFSGSVYSAMNKNEIPAVYLGIKRFRGVAYPVKIYRIKSHGEDKRKETRLFWRGIRNVAWWVIFLLVLYLILHFLFRVL